MALSDLGIGRSLEAALLVYEWVWVSLDRFRISFLGSGYISLSLYSSESWEKSNFFFDNFSILFFSFFFEDDNFRFELDLLFFRDSRGSFFCEDGNGVSFLSVVPKNRLELPSFFLLKFSFFVSGLCSLSINFTILSISSFMEVTRGLMMDWETASSLTFWRIW